LQNSRLAGFADLSPLGCDIVADFRQVAQVVHPALTRLEPSRDA
jgi:hypothetical protein